LKIRKLQKTLAHSGKFSIQEVILVIKDRKGKQNVKRNIGNAQQQSWRPKLRLDLERRKA